MRPRLCASVTIVLMLVALPRAQDAEFSWAITRATLIDGTGAPIVPGSVIVGRGERITCVGTAAKCPVAGSSQVLDAAGRWVIPGLIDTHVHLYWTSAADARRSQLIRFAFGTTTTREAGTAGNLEANLTHRLEAISGTFPEPRLIVSALVSDDNMKRYGLNAADLVRKLGALGADAIKIKQDFNAEEWRAIVGEAHKVNLPVWGHTWTLNSSRLNEALDAGIDGLAHLLTFSEFAQSPAVRDQAPDGIEFWVWIKEKWNDLDGAQLRTVSDRIIRQGVWLEPLLVTEKHFTLPYPLPDDLAYLGEVPSLKRLIRPWLPYGDSSRWAADARSRRISRAFEHMCDFLKGFHARGGIVVTGTDEEPAGPALIDEIGLLTDCGFSPAEALQAATRHAAAALHSPDIGTIEPGKLGDLVIVNADPLGRSANLRNVWRVIKGGHVHDPAVLLGSIVAEHETQERQTWAMRALTMGLLLVVAGLAAQFKRRPGKRAGD